MSTQDIEIIDLDDYDGVGTFYTPTANLSSARRVSIASVGSSKVSGSALNATSLRRLPANAPLRTKEKGKGRVRAPEIIELSDSDSDAPSTSKASVKLASSSKRHTTTASRVEGLPQAGSSGNTLVANWNDQNNIVQNIDNITIEDPRLATPEAQAQTSAEQPATLDGLVTAVIEVIPDVNVDYITYLYQLQASRLTDTVLPHSAYLQSILTALFDNPDYPKVSGSIQLKRKREVDDNAAGPSKRQKQDHIIRTVMNLDVASNARPQIVSAAYRELSLYWLGVQFSRVKKNAIRTYFLSNNRLFAPTFVQLSLLQLQGFPGVDMKKQRTRPLANGPPWRDIDFDREYNWCLDWEPGKSGEIQWIEETSPDDASGQMKVAEERVDAKIESVECEPGTGVDCGCCFSEYVANTMIQCPDGHLFCKACVLAFSQERLGQRNAQLKCMDQANCENEFERKQLELCLPPKLMALYERIKQAEELAAAGLINLEECPFCDFKCVIENDLERLFHCLDDDCGITSCRRCKKKDHLPKTCQEAEEDNTLNAQHSVEEAMTKALMRKCPKCDATFIKSDGCNKITCSKCSQLSCYICRKAITGYDHFNQMPGALPTGGGNSNTPKCPLWDEPAGGDQTGQLARRHHDEVVRAREAALAELRQRNPEVNVDELKVDAPELAPGRPAQRPAQLPGVPGLANILRPQWLPRLHQMLPANPFNALPFGHPRQPYPAPYQQPQYPLGAQPPNQFVQPFVPQYQQPPPAYYPQVARAAPVAPVAPIAPVAPVAPAVPHPRGWRGCNCEFCRRMQG